MAELRELIGEMSNRGTNCGPNAFQTDPGYQFALQQGTQALDRSAGGSGMFGSGNAATALTNYGQGLANQQYGNWLSNLSGLNNQGLQAAAGQTGRQGALAGINEWQGGQAVANNNNAVNGFVNAQNNMNAANAQGGANIFSTILGGTNLGAKAGPGFFGAPTQAPSGGWSVSDRKMKTDIETLGKDRETGLKMYAYRYKSDAKITPKVVGPMAQISKRYGPIWSARLAGLR